LFQGKVLDEYDRIVDEYGLSVISAVGSITEQQRIVRDVIARHLTRIPVEERVETPDEQPV
jgi:dTMP kinase